MKWVEIFLKFVVDIIHYAAWPAVVIFALIFFSKPLRGLIKGIKKFTHKETSIDFTEGVAAEVKKVVGDRDFVSATKETLNYEKYLYDIQGLGVVIAIFASRVRKLDKQWPLLGLGDEVLEMIADKVKEERPTSWVLKFLSTKLKTVKSKDEQKE